MYRDAVLSLVNTFPHLEVAYKQSRVEADDDDDDVKDFVVII